MSSCPYWIVRILENPSKLAAACKYSRNVRGASVRGYASLEVSPAFEFKYKQSKRFQLKTIALVKPQSKKEDVHLDHEAGGYELNNLYGHKRRSSIAPSSPTDFVKRHRVFNEFGVRFVSTELDRMSSIERRMLTIAQLRKIYPILPEVAEIVRLLLGRELLSFKVDKFLASTSNVEKLTLTDFKAKVISFYLNSIYQVEGIEVVLPFQDTRCVEYLKLVDFLTEKVGLKYIDPKIVDWSYLLTKPLSTFKRLKEMYTKQGMLEELAWMLVHCPKSVRILGRYKSFVTTELNGLITATENISDVYDLDRYSLSAVNRIKFWTEFLGNEEFKGIKNADCLLVNTQLYDEVSGLVKEMKHIDNLIQTGSKSILSNVLFDTKTQLNSMLDEHRNDILTLSNHRLLADFKYFRQQTKDQMNGVPTKVDTSEESFWAEIETQDFKKTQAELRKNPRTSLIDVAIALGTTAKEIRLKLKEHPFASFVSAANSRLVLDFVQGVKKASSQQVLNCVYILLYDVKDIKEAFSEAEQLSDYSSYWSDSDNLLDLIIYLIETRHILNLRQDYFGCGCILSSSYLKRIELKSRKEKRDSLVKSVTE